MSTSYRNCNIVIHGDVGHFCYSLPELPTYEVQQVFATVEAARVSAQAQIDAAFDDMCDTGEF
jgi:hypothetical protein